MSKCWLKRIVDTRVLLTWTQSNFIWFKLNIDVTDHQGFRYRTKAGEEESSVMEVPVCDHNFYMFLCVHVCVHI